MKNQISILSLAIILMISCSKSDTAITTSNVNNYNRVADSLYSNDSIVVNHTSTNILCKGNNTGSINLTVTGGIAPYTYLWNNGTTDANRSNLYAGTYIVTVTDSLQSNTKSITITEPATGILLTGTSKKPKCTTSANGTATVAVSGGIVPYTYLWSNSQTTNTSTGLSAGNYTVTVTESGGCTRSMTFALSAPTPITITLTPTSPNNAPLYNNGQIVAVASGGTPNYLYLWNTSPIKTTATITGLSSGIYTVKVTDKNGCTSTSSSTN